MNKDWVYELSALALNLFVIYITEQWRGHLAWIYIKQDGYQMVVTFCNAFGSTRVFLLEDDLDWNQDLDFMTHFWVSGFLPEKH